MKEKFYLVIFMASAVASCADCNNFLYFVLWHIGFAIPLIYSGYKLIEMKEEGK